MEKTKDRPLTAKQQAFCEEYLVDLNATQAALRAGYCANSVNKVGPANLVKVGISKEIHRLRAERSDRTQVKADAVVNELAGIAFGKLSKKPSYSNKLTALDLLAKHLGLYEADNKQKAPITLIDIIARMCCNGNGSS